MINSSDKGASKAPLLAARQISLRGMVGQILPPTSLEVTQDGLTIITGGSQMAKNALGLILTGRMKGVRGHLELGEQITFKQLRMTSALIDAPGLTEPDEWMTLGKFVTGELKVARKAHNQQAVQEFLESLDAASYLHTKINHLPIDLRYKVVLDLVRQRQNRSGEELINTFCFVSPARHDSALENWWQPLVKLLEAKLDYTVILICQESIYSDLLRLYPGILREYNANKFEIGNGVTQTPKEGSSNDGS